MTHKSALRNLVRSLLILFLALDLGACQSVGDMIWSLLPTPDLSAYTLPIGSTPVGMLSIPTQRPPAPMYTELTVGDMAISVRRIVRPADDIVGKKIRYNPPKDDEEYLLVEVQVYCLPDADKPCRITESDFGVSGDARRDYMAEFSINFDDLDYLFEGGEIEPDHSLHGDLVFIVRKNDTGLIMTYPRVFNFGTAAQFWLDP